MELFASKYQKFSVFIHLSGIINQFLLTTLYISVSSISIVLSLVLYVHVFLINF